jgi:hypothetical protein
MDGGTPLLTMSLVRPCLAVAGRASTARPTHSRARLQANESARLLQRHGERSVLLPGAVRWDGAAQSRLRDYSVLLCQIKYFFLSLEELTVLKTLAGRCLPRIRCKPPVSRHRLIVRTVTFLGSSWLNETSADRSPKAVTLFNRLRLVSPSSFIEPLLLALGTWRGAAEGRSESFLSRSRSFWAPKPPSLAPCKACARLLRRPSWT